jgi:hypothetical protein
MPRFRKKPVVIEAVQVTTDKEGIAEICRFCPRAALYPGGQIGIKTLEGNMTASVGDWIIKGVQGEFYPCKPDIFEATYELVQDKETP